MILVDDLASGDAFFVINKVKLTNSTRFETNIEKITVLSVDKMLEKIYINIEYFNLDTNMYPGEPFLITPSSVSFDVYRRLDTLSELDFLCKYGSMLEDLRIKNLIRIKKLESVIEKINYKELVEEFPEKFL